MCNLPHWLGHHRPPRSAGSRNSDRGRDSPFCNSTRCVVIGVLHLECSTDLSSRLLTVLLIRSNLCKRYDIPDCAKVWKKKPSDLHLDMLYCRLGLGHVCQGLWYSTQINAGWQQSIYASFYIRLYNCSRGLYFDANELLQQGLEPISNIIVSISNPGYSQNLIFYARVNPLYYVTFTTATLCASFVLFQGFNTADAVNTISLLCGFLVIFTGVYLLNLSRGDPDGHTLLNGKVSNGIPTDGIASIPNTKKYAGSKKQYRKPSSQQRRNELCQGGPRRSYSCI